MTLLEPTFRLAAGAQIRTGETRRLSRNVEQLRSHQRIVFDKNSIL